jgi:hypothetical protein
MTVLEECDRAGIVVLKVLPIKEMTIRGVVGCADLGRHLAVKNLVDAGVGLLYWNDSMNAGIEKRPLIIGPIAIRANVRSLLVVFNLNCN